jgi:hypothetical protein
LLARRRRVTRVISFDLLLSGYENLSCSDVAMHLNANGQHLLRFYRDVLNSERLQTPNADWACGSPKPASGGRRTVFGTELRVWAMPDLRFGLGYNFTAAG